MARRFPAGASPAGRSSWRPIEADVGVREDLPVGVGDDDVGHVGIAHGVLDEDVQVQMVVGEQRALRAGGEVLGHGEAALGHLLGEAPLLLLEQEEADQGHGQDHEGRDEQDQLGFQGQPDSGFRGRRRVRLISHPRSRFLISYDVRLVSHRHSKE